MRRIGSLARAAASLVLALGLAGCAAAPGGGAAGCPDSHERPMVMAELYLGRVMPGGGRIGPAEWSGFLADVVTPRFPDGFTVLDGYGQYRRHDNGLIAHEDSSVIVVAAPSGPATEVRLGQIIAAYKARFHQEAVLKVEEIECVGLE